ncbi:DUF4139 domain-containing protein [Lysobacter sp. SG-8]|uniref:DUF4139 domain-containing protein n=1 Tax=Marilutibacter penaei TaxID=2759900 RepID=A0A7W3U623_9GAMM|nr:DUF4139 domain-containing protein [Lysobacter penaei]MBB1089330.1 DUF4139 domain-containing protein [Lysobacter penaei]
MHRPLTLLATACLLAACSQDAPTDATARKPVLAQAPEDTPAAASGPDTASGTLTRLTVYSGGYEALAYSGPPEPGMAGYALVERPLHYRLKAGENTVRANNVAPAMDAEAALLQARAPGIRITSQRHVPALGGTGDLLSRAVGQRIVVEHTSGGAKQTDNGILLAASDGLSLALNDGRVKVIRDYDSFSILEAANSLPGEAALQWTVQADNAGEADFVLSYPMGGMAWRAEYLARLQAGDGCTLSLDGAAQVANRSGVSFSDARLTLVAGEPSRVAPSRQRAAYDMAEAAMAPSPAPPAPTERSSGEYHAYDLPGSSRIANGATERLALFPARDSVACTRDYVVDSGVADWIPQRVSLQPTNRGLAGSVPVRATVAFDNTPDAGLGLALPAGRVRLFEGADFLGEASLGHTPAGESLRLEVGNAFDLTAERQATAFNVAAGGLSASESFDIRLANAKDADVQVRVREPMPRWRDWELLDSSVPADETGAQHAEFLVTVPAGGEAHLTYTVRYRWPRNMAP